MDEAVRKMLEEKYADRLGTLSQAQAFSNLGDVIAGSKVGTQNPYFEAMRGQEEKQTLGKIEREQKAEEERQKAKQLLDYRLQSLAQQEKQALSNEELKREQMRQNEILAKFKIGDQKADKQRSISERLDKEFESNIQKLSKSAEGTQSALNAIDNVEQTLGAPLESFEIKGGKLTKDGKGVDLPGVSLPLVGRVSAYSDAARNLQSAASTVFNTILKDRSGAAVTNSELERLKIEFGQGKYNTEAELVNALKLYKLGVAKELKNREAGFKPEVVEEYTTRGGRTSKTLPQQKEAPAQQGKTVVKKLQNKMRNQTKYIYSDGTEEVIDGLE